MDAPKRIWTDWKIANAACVAFDGPPANEGEGYRTEYILASEHAAEVAGLRAQVARLTAERDAAYERAKKRAEAQFLVDWISPNSPEVLAANRIKKAIIAAIRDMQDAPPK